MKGLTSYFSDYSDFWHRSLVRFRFWQIVIAEEIIQKQMGDIVVLAFSIPIKLWLFELDSWHTLFQWSNNFASVREKIVHFRLSRDRDKVVIISFHFPSNFPLESSAVLMRSYLTYQRFQMQNSEYVRVGTGAFQRESRYLQLKERSNDRSPKWTQWVDNQFTRPERRTLRTSSTQGQPRRTNVSAFEETASLAEWKRLVALVLL